MNSPSRQWDFEPLELPFTQFLKPFTALTLDPAHSSSFKGGPTEPFVHWSRLPEAAAQAGTKAASGAMNAASTAMTSPVRMLLARTVLLNCLGTALPPFLLCLVGGISPNRVTRWGPRGRQVIPRSPYGNGRLKLSG